MKLDEVDIHSIQCDPLNTRLHSPQQLAKIKASLLRYGQQIPLLVRPDRTVIAGNGRLTAMQELGLTRVHVIFTELDDLKSREYSIADNALHDLSAFDGTALSQVLATLSAEDGFDPAALGYDPDELAKLIQAQNELPPDAGGVSLDDAALAGEVKTTKCPHCGGEVPV